MDCVCFCCFVFLLLGVVGRKVPGSRRRRHPKGGASPEVRAFFLSPIQKSTMFPFLGGSFRGIVEGFWGVFGAQGASTMHVWSEETRQKRGKKHGIQGGRKKKAPNCGRSCGRAVLRKGSLAKGCPADQRSCGRVVSGRAVWAPDTKKKLISTRKKPFRVRHSKKPFASTREKTFLLTHSKLIY